MFIQSMHESTRLVIIWQRSHPNLKSSKAYKNCRSKNLGFFFKKNLLGSSIELRPIFIISLKNRCFQESHRFSIQRKIGAPHVNTYKLHRIFNPMYWVAPQEDEVTKDADLSCRNCSGVASSISHQRRVRS